MKTPHDPRHQRRKRLLEELFKRDFAEQQISDDAKKIFSSHTILDQKIHEVAPEFPIEKINKIDLAILRLAVYELTIDTKEPPRVVVDEAIELAKEYGGDASPAFINGALGKLVKHD
ncbi:MAG: transcription antitermination protein NusB [bacterium]|nr:transcription antitermination protein NusB [bacterium]